MEFLNSNGLQTLIALITGLFVFITYKINKMDKERNAAQIILAEIRSIEDEIDNIRDRDDFYNSSPVITTNSWEKYNYLFTDLDEDEFKLVNSFYNMAKRIEEQRIIARNQMSIVFEQKAKLLQEKIADKAYECLGDIPKFQTEIKQITELMYLNTPIYEADGPKQLIKKLANEVSYITTTSAGQKIKVVINKRFLWFF